METLKSRERLPDRVYRMTMSAGSKPKIFQITLAQALEELKSAYKSPEEALLKSSADNPLNVKRVCYWV